MSSAPPPDGSFDTPDDSVSWLDIAPDWITENVGFLKAFADSPRETIIGILSGVLISRATDLWEIVLDGVMLVLWGDSLASTDGQLGVIDLPLRAVELLLSPFGTVGDGLLAPLEAVYGGASGFVGGLGIVAWPVAVGVVVVTIVVFDRVLRRTGRASLAAIPVIGPFLEALLR